MTFNDVLLWLIKPACYRQYQPLTTAQSSADSTHWGHYRVCLCVLMCVKPVIVSVLHHMRLTERERRSCAGSSSVNDSDRWSKIFSLQY